MRLTPTSLASVADRTKATSGVRMSLRQTMSIPGAGTVPATAAGRFDTEVDVTLPPASETVGFGDLTRGLTPDAVPGSLTLVPRSS